MMRRNSSRNAPRRPLGLAMASAVGFATALGLAAQGCTPPEEDETSGTDSTDGPATGDGDGDTGGDGDSDTGATTGGERMQPTCANPPTDDKVYQGSVLIDGTKDTPVADQLKVLEGFKYIQGALVINRTELENLDALICIAGVAKELTVFGNSKLKDLWGLRSITITAGDVLVSENVILEDLDGLQGITEVQNLSVTENPAVKSLKGLDSVKTVHKSLVIRFNEMLEDISALVGLEVVADRFDFVHNPNVCVSKINAIGAALTMAPSDGSTVGNDDGC